jgi:hypothetical protein
MATARTSWSIARMANWFYLAGSCCFAVGTLINMVRR